VILRIMKMKTILLALCLTLPSASFAQQVAVESCDVSVVVNGFDNQGIQDLSPSDFLVRVGDIPQAVESASIDRGPKRIALMLDASRNIPKEEWDLETSMAAVFIKNARPKDQFAFSLIGTADNAASFLSSNELAGRLQELARSRPAMTDANEKIYDGILAAAIRLDPPQFGDAIFLFGHNEDFGSTATSDHVVDVILRNKLRFFGMSFADQLAKLPAGFDLNKPLPKEFGRSKLDLASAETGYFFAFHGVRSLNIPGQMPLFHAFLGDLYAWIAEPYRLKIPVSTMKDKTQLEISVANLETRKVHKDGIHYARSLYPCVAPPLTDPKP
jgi:hypothetical protein